MYFIQMSGVPGSGKSTLAKAISQNLDVVIVDHDTTKTALLEQVKDVSQNSEVGKVSYHLDWAIIESLMIQNKNIIFDSPCLYEVIVEKGIHLADKYGYEYKYVECINKDFVEVSKRLSDRKAKLSQIKEFGSYEVFSKALKNSKKPKNGAFRTVNSSKELETYLMEVLKYIRET